MVSKKSGMKFSTWLNGIPKPARSAVYKWESVQDCIKGTRLIGENVGRFSDDLVSYAVRGRKLRMHNVVVHFNTFRQVGEDVFWTRYV